MSCKMLLVFCCVTAFVTTTRADGDKDRKRYDRASRFISFDNVKDDIEVNLDFTVPFLSIPFKKTIDSMFEGLPGLAIPQIKVNPLALAFGGLIVVLTSVILPLFSKGLSFHNTNPYYRVLDNGSDETNILTDFTNQLMSVSRGCPLKIACWMSQRPNNFASAKTVEQIIRNKLMTSVFNTTSVEEAILNGRRGRDCETYEPCPLREEQLLMIMKNFSILTSRNIT